MKRQFIIYLLILIPQIGLANQLYRSPQPVDNGKYYIIEHKKLDDGLIDVLSSRVGKNNAYTDFTILNAHRKSLKYLELGGTSAEGLRDAPTKTLRPWSNAKWTSLVSGSSKSDLVQYVCKAQR